MTKARNNRTEAIRISVESADFIRFMADVEGLSFKQMTSRIIREWAELKVKK